MIRLLSYKLHEYIITTLFLLFAMMMMMIIIITGDATAGDDNQNAGLSDINALHELIPDLEGKGESNKANIGIDPLISPEWFDYMAAFYVGNNDIKNPQISPIYADLKGFPPMLIQAGSDEVILDDSKRLAEQALEVGVEVTLDIWENMWHVWQLSGGLMPEATMALQKAGEFVRKHID